MRLKPATTVRKAISRLPVTPQKNLLPPKTGGKLFLPGFHRTRQETAAASIILDSLKSDKLKGTCLYGKGFYMTRTFTNQNTARMISSYGAHLVRCRVDISRFVCFDRAIAKRVWGEKYTLQEQLENFGPWGKDEEDFIEDLSKALSAYWTNRKSKDATYVREYSRKPEQITRTADVARSMHLKLKLFEKVPGIAYTGKSDGACVLAYHLDRVTPVAMTLADKEKSSLRKLEWIKSTDRKIQRRYAPDVAMKDDLATYLQQLSAPGTQDQKIARIQSSFAALPKDPFDAFVFSLATIKVCRAKGLHDVRDEILSQTANTILTLLRLEIPHFAFCTDAGRAGSRHFYASARVYVKVNERSPSERRDEIEAYRSRYLKLIKAQSVIWDFLRYQWFLKVALYHKTIFLKDIYEALHTLIKKKSTLVPFIFERDLKNILFPVFGGLINRYGEIVGDRSRTRRSYQNGVETEGIILLGEKLRGIRDDSGHRSTKPEKAPSYYSLIGVDEYEQFMRSQILKVYDALRKNPVIEAEPAVMKILNRWYRKYGHNHRKKVRAFPDYDEIGGTF